MSIRKSCGSQCGAPGSYTLLGPPERIKASGFNSRTRSGVMSWRTIRAKACRSRTRRDELNILGPKVEDKNRPRRGIDELHEPLRSSRIETDRWC